MKTISYSQVKLFLTLRKKPENFKVNEAGAAVVEAHRMDPTLFDGVKLDKIVITVRRVVCKDLKPVEAMIMDKNDPFVVLKFGSF